MFSLDLDPTFRNERLPMPAAGGRAAGDRSAAGEPRSHAAHWHWTATEADDDGRTNGSSTTCRVTWRLREELALTSPVTN